MEEEACLLNSESMEVDNAPTQCSRSVDNVSGTIGSSAQSMQIEEDNAIAVDYAHQFVPSEVIRSRDELIKWVHAIAYKHGHVLVIRRSDSGEHKHRSRITFACERNGKYDERRKPQGKRRNTGTKKCGCPFRLVASVSDEGDSWTVNVKCGIHNHSLGAHLEGHSAAGRLSNSEKQLVLDMSKSFVKPKAILNTLKEKNPNNLTTVRGVYNARRKSRVKEAARRSLMQQLLDFLEDKNYIEWHRSDGDSDAVFDLFFAHPTSIEYVKAFSSVLVMDTTCKTNNYRYPLLQIVGFTSTELMFPVAFVYLKKEWEDNFVWALERLKGLLSEDQYPHVVTTNTEVALINAVERVFPTASHLLCRWHISKCVLTNCKALFPTKELWDQFNNRWEDLVRSECVEVYESKLTLFKEDFAEYKQALHYVTNNWLIPFKERFVGAWTNKLTHFGLTTMQRAEGAYSRLKHYLGSNQCTFLTSWMTIHSMSELCYTEIKASFERSKTMVQHRFTLAELKDIRGLVSCNALELVLNEIGRMNAVGVEKVKCGCVIKYTHGLLCAHEIAELKLMCRPIPLDSIHAHWRKLDTNPIIGDLPKITIVEEWEAIERRFMKSDESGKLAIKRKLGEIAWPSTTHYMEPMVSIRTCEHPSTEEDCSTNSDPSACEVVESQPESDAPVVESSTKDSINSMADKLELGRKLKDDRGEFIFINAETIKSILSYSSLVQHFHNLLPAVSASIQSPVCQNYSIGAFSTLLLMPSWSMSPSLPYIGIKVVTSFPQNSMRNLPGVNASYLLIDSSTGWTLATMDGSELTHWRTSCMSALAAKFLARKDAEVLVMIGAGSLAAYLIRAHLFVTPTLKKVIIWNRTGEKAKVLAKKLQEGESGGICFVCSNCLDDIVPLGDIISCATSSESPLVKGNILKPGTHLDLIGSFTPSMRECDDEAIWRGRVFVDCEAALVESGELVGAFERGVISRADIAGTLLDLVKEEKVGRQGSNEITVFKSVGSAVMDILAAQLVYETYLHGCL